MKKIIALCLLLIATFYSFSQDNQEKQKKYKWGCAVSINSMHGHVGFWQTSAAAVGGEFMDADGNLFSGGNKKDKSLSLSIIPKYFIRDDILLRFEFGISNLNLRSDYEAKYFDTHQINNLEINSRVFKYACGIQWNILKKRILEIYCGMNLNYLNYSTLTYEGYAEHRVLPADTVSNWVKSSTTIPGGFGFGVGVYSGFNIYLQKHISLGGEFSSALMYFKSEGEIKNEIISQSPSDPSITTEKNQFSSSYNAYKFTKVIASINISCWF